VDLNANVAIQMSIIQLPHNKNVTILARELIYQIIQSYMLTTYTTYFREKYVYHTRSLEEKDKSKLYIYRSNYPRRHI
jgi:hypothetical protein